MFQVNGVSETADDSDNLKIEAVTSEVKDEKEEVSQGEEKSQCRPGCGHLHNSLVSD